MTNKKRIGQGIDPDLVQAAGNIAKSLGYTIGRGPHANEGSINQLIEAIARNKLLVVAYPEDRTGWDAVRRQFVNDSEMIDYLLDFYLQRRMPLNDDSDPIVGWNRVYLNVAQPCYECDQPVSGDCYQAMGKELYAHSACIEKDEV